MKLLISIYLVLTLTINVNAQVYIQKLNASINSDEYDEICPVLSLDGQYLYFTRVGDPLFVKTIFHKNKDQHLNLSPAEYTNLLSDIYSQIAGHEILSPVDSEFNQDIWIASSVDGLFDQVVHPGAPLNNALPNSVCAVYPKRNAIVVINQFGEKGGMKEGFSIVELDDGGNFKFPVPLDIHQFQESGTGVNLSMSQDGNYLFLSLERDDSEGKHDIYFCSKVYEDFWSHPARIETGINTEFDETTPFISKDQRRIYFSSDRPESEGGKDLFVSERLDYTYLNWSEPKKLNVPINTGYDESQPYLDANEDYLYFTSNRDGTSDIFRVSLDSIVDIPEAIKLNLTIVDAETNLPTGGELRWGPFYQDSFTDFFRTYSGKYQLLLMKNEPLRIEANKIGFTKEEIIVSPEELIDSNLVYDLEIHIHKHTPIKERKDLLLFGKKRRIILEDIYFVRAKSEVLPKSYTELDKLVKVLRDNPEIHIIIEGHTDALGDPDDNLALSESRAKAIKSFLVERQIKPVRISTKGFGSSKPLNKNETESERAQNRRVEIRIIKE